MNDQDTEKIATRLMATAMAHQRTSTLCLSNQDANTPMVESVFYYMISIEMVLFSMEQSFRLLLLLNFGKYRESSKHSPHELYNDVCLSSDRGVAMKKNILNKVNELGSQNMIDRITEDELRSCLKTHRETYSRIRYFLMQRRGKIDDDFTITIRDGDVFQCVALALIQLNYDMMRQRGFQMWLEARKVEDPKLKSTIMKRLE